MDEYQDPGNTDETDPTESALITDLRSRNRKLEKDVNDLRALQAEVEVAAQTQRSETAKGIMDTLGLSGLTEDMLQWVPGDITQEAVVEALEARSIPLPEGTVQQTPVEKQTPSASTVGQQVADAAAGADGRSLAERINSAETQEELNALMEEAELTHNHY